MKKYHQYLPSAKMSSVYISQVRIDNITFNEAIDRIEQFIKNRRPSYIVTPNVDHIVKLQDDKEFQKIYHNADLAIVDSVPLLLTTKYLNTPLKEKISGSDLFPAFCGVAAQKGYRVFLLGGRPGAARKAGEVLKNKYTSLQIRGTYCPPYNFENDELENNHIVDIIKKAEPDILFVGLGAPKQEKWIYKYKELYSVPVSIGIGVSFEFIAGMVKRAPRWMQKIGLEWFWRLILEPKRLWKRYLVDGLKFFRIIIKQAKKKSSGH